MAAIDELTLWDLSEPEESGAFDLRDYQAEDLAEMEALIARGIRSIVARIATGLGKSVYLAEAAYRLVKHGRVLVTVDVGPLALDLVRTISKHIGKPCGVLTGDLKENLSAPIVVSTVQTLYAKDRETGVKRCDRDIVPEQFAAFLIDECEASVATEFSGVVRHMKKNNKLVTIGVTATPFRADGRGMIEHFEYASDEPGLLNRDILWGRDNGWLVGIRQAFVRASVNFATLKVRKGADGEKDYTDDEVAALLSEEKTQAEMAAGIQEVTKGEAAIIICPDVETAKLQSYHLNRINGGSAEAAYGALGRQAKDLIAAHKRGDFPLLTSVNMLYKGYDNDLVRHVVMCRKTRSRRLYEQAMGRGTRPLVGIRQFLAEAANADMRRGIITASAKPFMTMVDLVGIDANAKDLGVIDILGERLPNDVKAIAKQMILKGETKKRGGGDVDHYARLAAMKAAEIAERNRRAAIDVQAKVDIEITDNLNAVNGGQVGTGRIPPNTLALLRKAKVPEDMIATMPLSRAKQLAQTIVARWKTGLCTVPQARTLANHGYNPELIKVLKMDQASALITAMRDNHWRYVDPARVLPELGK